jgi:hypothetical protein
LLSKCLLTNRKINKKANSNFSRCIIVEWKQACRKHGVLGILYIDLGYSFICVNKCENLLNINMLCVFNYVYYTPMRMNE